MGKKQDFVVKGKSIYVGLEDSKRSWRLCIRCQGMIVQETSLPTEYANLRRFLLGSYPECRIAVIYEAGFQGFWLHDLLTADGIECVVTPANKVTQAKDSRVKTDKIDARRLAQNLESGDYCACWVPDPELREDRQISRTLTQIQRDIVATKNRIRKFLDFHGLNGELPAGKWGETRYRQLAGLKLRPSLQIALDAYLQLLTELQKLHLHLRRELAKLSEKPRYQGAVTLKRSCPGIGPLSAIRFTLELGDLSRFRESKQLGSYLGLAVSEHSTGESIRRGRITRQGNSQMRAWLIQSAWVAIRHDPVLLQKFHRIWQNSGRKKAAIVGVARKLAERMRVIELKQEPYEIGLIQ